MVKYDRLNPKIYAVFHLSGRSCISANGYAYPAVRGVAMVAEMKQVRAREMDSAAMTYKVLSLGWGVQSFTLAAMAALGEFERPDVAIHADTTHESILTYQFARRWTKRLEEHGVRVVTVKNDKYPDVFDTSVSVIIPAYTDTNSGGLLSRQCTTKWKRAPMRRWIQSNRDNQPVELWLGISKDEALRMKPSDVKYITHRWPLIEMGMSRKDCGQWLQEHKLEIPPRSACTFCPYHDTKEWQRIKATPEDWAEAVAVDNAIRKARPPYDLYVHPSRNPLEDIDLRTLEEMGQMRLWDEECSGICGV
jgi:hypothetical protein